MNFNESEVLNFALCVQIEAAMNPLEYLARWHVIVIHFPIALIITAALAELAHMLRRKEVAGYTVLLTGIAAIAAVLASGPVDSAPVASAPFASGFVASGWGAVG